VGWVKKWKKRLQEAEPEDEQVLHSRSRARIHAPARLSQTVVARLIQRRDEPPEGLRRTPGPKALLDDLPRDEQLQGERLPRSSRTIERILQQAGRIAQRVSHMQERPAPMSHWQLDLKDVTTVPPHAFGKQHHVVEVLNVLDEGTSVLVEAQVRADFHAETTLEGLAELFVRQGLPQVIRLERDGRFVGSPRGSDFPSARVRLCECLGVGVRLGDPHHPQQNGFVERYNRTSQQDCLAVDRPGTREQVREVTDAFAQHYHWSRPHQGLSCGNQPPRVAFPTVPELPSVRVDLKSYYVGRALAGQHVALHLSAAKRALLVVHAQQVIKTLPLKDLSGQALRFEAFVQLMMGQARSERRLRTAQERRVRLGGSDSPERYDGRKQKGSRGWYSIQAQRRMTNLSFDENGHMHVNLALTL
jgi:transposase InsO family protein